MFIKSTITALFALVAQGVLAQNATTQDVNVLEANFQQADLVPALLPTFSPQGLLNVAFSGSDITTGQALTADAVASSPTITVEPVEGATEIGMGGDYVYTAMLVDADIVGTDEMTTNQTFHWVANGATIGANNALDLSTSTAAINYVGPGPLVGTGPHRYTLLLVRQYSNFTAPAGLSFGAHSTSDYLGTTGLGSVVAANYFTVENGAATMSISSTMAVDTATVAGAAATTADSSASSMGSASSMASMSMSMSMSSMASKTSAAASGVTSSAAAAASTGAGVSTKLGGNVLAAGITVVGIAMGAFML